MDNFFDLLVPLFQLGITIIIIALFFMFVAQPLFKYLSVNREIELRMSQGDRISTVKNGPDSIVRQQPDAELGDNHHRARSSKKEILDRLAASDPEKAGNLIKKWLNEN